MPQRSLRCLLQSSPKCQALYTFCFCRTDAWTHGAYLTGGAKVACVVTDARSALASPSAVTQLLVFGHAVFSSQVAAAGFSHPVLVAYALIAQTLPVTTAESAREKTSWCQHAVVCEKQDGLKQCIFTCCHVWGTESWSTRSIARKIVPPGFPSPGTHKLHLHTPHYCCTQGRLGESDTMCH